MCGRGAHGQAPLQRRELRHTGDHGGREWGEPLERAQRGVILLVLVGVVPESRLEGIAELRFRRELQARQVRDVCDGQVIQRICLCRAPQK